MSGKLTVVQLARCIELSGGHKNAIHYGLHANDIDDPQTAAIWKELEGLYDQIDPLKKRVDDLMEILEDRLVQSKNKES